MTAKPIIWAQQPATAAPPARPVRPSARQMAAEEMGRVRATPMTTETMIPMKKGWRLRGPHDGLSHGGGGLAHRGGNEGGEADTRQHRDDGRHQNIDLRLLTDGPYPARRPESSSTNRRRQRAAGSAHGVGGEAHGDQGEQHQRRGLQCPADRPPPCRGPPWRSTGRRWCRPRPPRPCRW